ncbi:hypothetical protein [Nannocystis bainbridge]|uniref:Uncharacterized protein n=1 Tax=Nannocystis bainbridge TaxID=2995303 RepID=A0ABT5EBC6_9BACT|nr:hypothetical protein [Nannocystis bainbridge]MDC0723176.1 hypothetical protein [Nannocystis bainbridge]
MGLFDFRCPVSGLSLRAADAVHVALIELDPGEWAPLSLPVVGCYDRGGSIDGFTPDFRTDLFAAGFARFYKCGRADGPDVSHELREFSRQPDFGRLLHVFERVNTMSQWHAMEFTLDGLPLRQVLIHAEVFSTVAPSEPPTRAPAFEAIEQQLAAAPVAPQAREMFEALIIADDPIRCQTAAALSQLAAFSRWLAERGKSWSPAPESGQYFVETDLEFAREARTTWAADPQVLSVVELVIQDLEEELAGGRRRRRRARAL